MLNIFKMKRFLFTPLIKWIVMNPGLMRSKLFLKAMLIFPSMVSKTYDKKIAGSGDDYHKALEQGLTRIFNKPRKILDLCTGTGFAAFKVAAAFPFSSIDAIDQITEMLDLARKKAQETEYLFLGKNICPKAYIHSRDGFKTHPYPVNIYKKKQR